MQRRIQHLAYRKALISLTLILVLFSPLLFVQATQDQTKIKEETQRQPRIIEGEYIVKLKDWGDDNTRSSLFERDANIKAKNEKIKTVKVSVSEDNKDKFLKRIRQHANVVWVEPNYIINVEMIPNDPSWNQQWGPQKISAPDAWNLEQGSENVLVAVIDTGICYTHPDLSSRYVPGGYDWVNEDNDPMDDHGHGTHCAGIIAATINNAQGIAGLAQAKIIAEKFLGATGSGSSFDAAQAIIHAVDFGKTLSDRIILSNSWGSSGNSSVVKEALDYAYENNVLIVAAAGNDASSSPFYPAAYPTVISVSATDSNDNLASFSNYGSTIEVSAPGVSIYSTYLNNGYKSLSGTSMAAPHVSGVAALIWSRFPDYNRNLVRIILQSKTDDLGGSGWDDRYGYGRVNAYKAAQGGPGHDIQVAALNLPPLIFPEELITITSIIKNIGTNSEYNINVELIIDSNQVSTETILEITSGESLEISFDWTPTHIGAYNITIFAIPIPEEDSTLNNKLSKTGSVQESGTVLVVSDDDGSYFSNYGTSKNEIVSILNNHGCDFNTWIESEYGRPTLNTLTQFKTVIWTCGDYWHWAVDPTDAETLIEYVNNGGTVILEGGDIGFDHFNDNFMANVPHATYQVDKVGSTSLTVTTASHPICEGLPTSFGWSINPGWEDGVIPNNGGEEIVKYTDTSFSALVSSGNGGAGSTIYMSFPIRCLQENIREKIIINSLQWLFQNSYTIRIESRNPELTGSKFYIDKIVHNIPSTISITEGAHNFAVCSCWSNETSRFVFDHWEKEDGQLVTKDIIFTENVQTNRTLYACFRETHPSCLNLSVSDIGNFTIGEEIEIDVTVTNIGSCPISNMLIKLILSQNVTMRYDESEQMSIAAISPGDSYNLTWHVVPNQAGVFRLLVTANGDDMNENPTVSLLRVKKDVVE